VRHAGGVLTTASLVGDAQTVDIITSEGKRYGASVVGRDIARDLVLLALDNGAAVPAATLADDVPPVGASVWVMGAASAGVGRAWISAGLLSSTDAVVDNDDVGTQRTGLFETDAASGAGAVGGALVDDDGEVTGIVLGRVGDGTTTYALPISSALEIADALDRDGVAPHGTTGMTIVDGPDGPTVMGMTPEGPAARAGMRIGDIVSAVDGYAVESIKDVMTVVRADEPGRTVTFQVVRGTDEHKVRVQLVASSG
jgi:putative serine protease PepD